MQRIDMAFHKSSTVKMLAFAIVLAVFFSRAGAVEPTLNSLDQAMNRLVYGVSRSVVTVEATTASNQVIAGIGSNPALMSLISSGLIIDTAGHILAAAQSVVGREHIRVVFENVTCDAKLVAIDYQTSLAILAVDRPFGEPVHLADEYTCAGQMIVAVGSSHGIRACATIGFCAGDREDGGLQFSAPVVSGSIGGGLFDLSGRLVGIVCGAVGERAQGEAGVAVPSHRIGDAVAHLLTRGDRKAGFLGVTTMESEIVPPLRLNQSNWLASAVEPSPRIYDQGIVITNMISASPAISAGLQRGDLIFRVDRRPLTSQWDLKNLIRSMTPGTWITIDYLRGAVPRSVRVQVGEARWLPWQETNSSGVAASMPSSSRDSLAHEIDRLKAAVKNLESRLQVAPK
jgi:S1-C subfamily serine protease